MFYVYVLENRKKDRYFGSTNDIKRRVQEHNSGQNQSTKSGKPWKVIFYEAFVIESDAKRREKYLKTSTGRRMFSRMIKDYITTN